MATTSASAAIGGYSRITYVGETTWGTTPSTPAMLTFRHTGCSLNLERDTLESKELRSDRMMTDVRMGVYNVTGDLDSEVSVGDIDDFFAAALFGEWTANVCKAGIVEQAFTIEKGFTNIGQYHAFSGCMIDKFQLSVKPNEMVTAKFSIRGKTMTSSTSPLDASPTAAGTNSPCDAFSGTISEGGSPIAYITGIDMTLDNGIVPVPVVGSKFPYRLAAGRSKLTGTVSAVFVDNTMLAKFLAETASTIEFTIKGLPDTKYFTFLIPEVKYTGAKVDINTEQVLQLDLPFYGVYDSGEGTNLKITRVP